ncbi:MAG: potassium channel family protein [Dehalococcoidia bacterium]
MPKRQVIVVGLGRFGARVARTLYRMGHDVLGIDTNEQLVQALVGQITYPVKADATSEAVLRELGAPNFDAAVIAIGSDVQASIMCTVLLKSIGMPYIVARARDDLHGRTLARVGANRIVYPEQEMGERVARSLFTPDVLEYMEVAPAFGISKVRLPESFHGITLKEAGLSGPRDKYGLAVLAIRRGKDVILLPSEDERIQPDDTFILAGKDDRLERLRE